MNLTSYIRNIENFPKSGVQFKDITPLLANSSASKECLDKLLELVGGLKIDKVVAIESRGFFFGTLMAQRLGAGFVPIRKPGKLPYSTHKEFYQLEYGQDAVEIHIDAISPGERVLLHDDVLATGGTAAAACRLIQKMEGEIVQCNFLLALEFLNGMEKLKNFEVKTLLKY